MAKVKETQVLKFTGTDSEVMYVDSKTAAALIIPNDSAFNSKTLTFKAGIEESALFTLKDMNGANITVTLSAATVIALDLPYFAGITHLQLIASGSLTGKSITVIFREL